MVICETSSFTRWVVDALSDEEYRAFQNRLCADPKAGRVIRGGGGLRKIRLALAGRGKSGGARVIYYYVEQRRRILLLFAYDKNVQGELTPEQVKALRQIVEREYP